MVLSISCLVSLLLLSSGTFIFEDSFPGRNDALSAANSGFPSYSIPNFVVSFLLPIKAKIPMIRRPTMLPITILEIRPGLKVVALVLVMGFLIASALVGDLIAIMFSCALRSQLH